MMLFRLAFSGPSCFSDQASSADQDGSVLLLFSDQVLSDGSEKRVLGLEVLWEVLYSEERHTLYVSRPGRLN